MTTKRTDAVAMTEEQLDAVASGLKNVLITACSFEGDRKTFRPVLQQRRPNRTAWDMGWLGRGF